MTDVCSEVEPESSAGKQELNEKRMHDLHDEDQRTKQEEMQQEWREKRQEEMDLEEHVTMEAYPIPQMELGCNGDKHSSGAGGGAGDILVVEPVVPLAEECVGLLEWNFNIWLLEEPHKLRRMLEAMFRIMRMLKPGVGAAASSVPCSPVAIPHKRFATFVSEIEKMYKANEYHSFRHACDVTHNVCLLVQTTAAIEILEEKEVLALMLAAVAHDAGHPGLNNHYLVTTNDPLAVRYNQKSVLESYHGAVCTSAMLSPRVTLLAHLDRRTQLEVQGLVTKIILATDMAKHHKLFMQFKNRTTDQASPFDRSCASDRLKLMKVLLKCADLASVAKEWHITQRWAYGLADELMKQSDQEEAMGIEVTPFMARENMAVPQNTFNFMSFTAVPFFGALAEFLPPLKETLMVQLEKNLKLWAEKAKHAQADPSLQVSLPQEPFDPRDKAIMFGLVQAVLPDDESHFKDDSRFGMRATVNELIVPVSNKWRWKAAITAATELRGGQGAGTSVVDADLTAITPAKKQGRRRMSMMAGRPRTRSGRASKWQVAIATPTSAPPVPKPTPTSVPLSAPSRRTSIEKSSESAPFLPSLRLSLFPDISLDPPPTHPEPKSQSNPQSESSTPTHLSDPPDPSRTHRSSSGSPTHLSVSLKRNGSPKHALSPQHVSSPKHALRRGQRSVSQPISTTSNLTRGCSGSQADSLLSDLRSESLFSSWQSYSPLSKPSMDAAADKTRGCSSMQIDSLSSKLVETHPTRGRFSLQTDSPSMPTDGSQQTPFVSSLEKELERVQEVLNKGEENEECKEPWRAREDSGSRLSVVFEEYQKSPGESQCGGKIGTNAGSGSLSSSTTTAGVDTVMSYKVVKVVMLFAVVFAMCGEDLKIAFVNKEYDDLFLIFAIVVICLFSLDLARRVISPVSPFASSSSCPAWLDCVVLLGLGTTTFLTSCAPSSSSLQSPSLLSSCSWYWAIIRRCCPVYKTALAWKIQGLLPWKGRAASHHREGTPEIIGWAMMSAFLITCSSLHWAWMTKNFAPTLSIDMLEVISPSSPEFYRLLTAYITSFEDEVPYNLVYLGVDPSIELWSDSDLPQEGCPLIYDKDVETSAGMTIMQDILCVDPYERHLLNNCTAKISKSSVQLQYRILEVIHKRSRNGSFEAWFEVTSFTKREALFNICVHFTLIVVIFFCSTV